MGASIAAIAHLVIFLLSAIGPKKFRRYDMKILFLIINAPKKTLEMHICGPINGIQPLYSVNPYCTRHISYDSGIGLRFILRHFVQAPVYGVSLFLSHFRQYDTFAKFHISSMITFLTLIQDTYDVSVI